MVTREELDKQVAKSLWIGDRLFPQHIISINSFIQNGFEYNLYVYDDVKNVPSGVILCDAIEVNESELSSSHKKLEKPIAPKSE